MASSIDNEIPQWKKDLIARLRNQNRMLATVGSRHQQLYTSPQLSSSGNTGHQPSLTCKSESVTSGISCTSVCDHCNVNCTCLPLKQFKMVQEQIWVENKHDLVAEMVTENYSNNGYHKDSDSDSSEDLHYGPGIVNKLKNRYLSLALRESTVRPSILQLRKATSLENLLDDDVSSGKSKNQQYQPRLNGNDTEKIIPNRYRNAARGEMKRARSVEAISRFDNHLPLISNDVRNNRQSLQEGMLISPEKEGNDHTYRKTQDNQLEINTENTFNSTILNVRINRPKRIQPIMNEKEKPPADVVKQAKLIFEKRPEQRTKSPLQTGDVAAKVDSFNNIIVKAKVEASVISKKPPIKHKPVLNDKVKSNTRPVAKPVVVSEDIIKSVQHTQLPKHVEFNKVHKIEVKEDVSLTSPIPDVSRIDFHSRGEHERVKAVTNLTETPDLILTSSPLPTLSSPNYQKSSTEFFLKEEILNSSSVLDISRTNSPPLSPSQTTCPHLSPIKVEPLDPVTKKTMPSSILSPTKTKPTVLIYDEHEADHPNYKVSSPLEVDNYNKQVPGTTIFNFTNQNVSQDHLPVNKNISHTKTPPLQPLKIEINGHTDTRVSCASPKLLQAQKDTVKSPHKLSPPLPPKSPEKKVEPVKTLTVTEIEKNIINAAKTLQSTAKSSVSGNSSVEIVNKNVQKKRSRPREPESNTAVFNFTSRKDVPDYISNDRPRLSGRPEVPKLSEGSVMLLQSDSLTDEEEEIMRSLEGPPSPCDVTFINDNILIDGKSSLSQKTKRTKLLKISFVDAGPEIYEYPSETSILLDDAPVSSSAQVSHTVPNLGTSLANYTPKSTEEFQPGITRSIQQNIPNKSEMTEVEPIQDIVLEEINKPFSSGTDTDILF